MSEVNNAAAERLRLATDTRTPTRPIRDLIAADDVAGAYAVQQLGVSRRLADGGRVVGHKIGLTSATVQAQLGVDQPDFGVLLDDMRVTGGRVRYDALLQPRIEAEVAFVLSQDLDGNELSLDDVAGAVARAHAALEIVDSRIEGWDITFVDTVADNASSGLFVLGDELPGDVVTRELTMEMTVNGRVVSRGAGSASLGDPLNALLWLAQTASSMGDPLQAGHIVLSGALGPMVAVEPGDRVVMTLFKDKAPLGSAGVDFTGR